MKQTVCQTRSWWRATGVVLLCISFVLTSIVLIIYQTIQTSRKRYKILARHIPHINSTFRILETQHPQVHSTFRPPLRETSHIRHMKKKAAKIISPRARKNMTNISYVKMGNMSHLDGEYLLEYINETGNYSRLGEVQRVFYNRVPKCGSRGVHAVFGVLARRQHWKLRRHPVNGPYHLSIFRVWQFVDHFNSIPGPFVYTGHIHMVNMQKLGVPNPVYINLIREPAERAISHFYYSLFGSTNNVRYGMKGRTMEDCLEEIECEELNPSMVLRFFCGHMSLCLDADDMVSIVAQAKQNVEKFYLTVGLTEHQADFMEVLETLMPRFFFNATAIHREKEMESIQKFKTSNKYEVKPKSMEKLKYMLGWEYEFYNFIKQRFFNQLNIVKQIKQSNATI